MSGSGSSSIPDTFKTIDELRLALNRVECNRAQLIVGIDFTSSNETSGAVSFGGRSLHTIDPSGKVKNPYQEVIAAVGAALGPLDPDGLIPAFGFGCTLTRAKTVLSLNSVDGEPAPCKGFEGVLKAYSEMAPRLELSGPTGFGPIIDKAIEIVMEEKEYHILLLICDGAVTNFRVTLDAMVRASAHPLSIVCVGVGDGPFEQMDILDNFEDHYDELKIDPTWRRQFDNFQFVEMEKLRASKGKGPRREISSDDLALGLLMEIPHQVKAIQELGYEM